MKNLKVYVIVDLTSETIIANMLCETESDARLQFEDFVRRFSSKIKDWSEINLVSVFRDPNTREVPMSIDVPVKFSELFGKDKLCRLACTGIEMDKIVNSDHVDDSSEDYEQNFDNK